MVEWAIDTRCVLTGAILDGNTPVASQIRQKTQTHQSNVTEKDPATASPNTFYGSIALFHQAHGEHWTSRGQGEVNACHDCYLITVMSSCRVLTSFQG